MHLLSLYKVFCPELVTLSIPSRIRVCTHFVTFMPFYKPVSSSICEMVMKVTTFFPHRAALKTTFPPGNLHLRLCRRVMVSRFHPASVQLSPLKRRASQEKGYVRGSSSQSLLFLLGFFHLWCSHPTYGEALVPGQWTSTGDSFIYNLILREVLFWCQCSFPHKHSL